MSELRKCPFCGGEDVQLHLGMFSVSIWCRSCDTYGPINMKDSEEEATEAWNARAEDSLRGGIEKILELFAIGESTPFSHREIIHRLKRLLQDKQ